VFNPDEISENIQKQGGFVPGLRPGRQTAEFLYKVLNRITLAGAIFLGLIAVLPYIIQAFTHTQALTLGGTSILIVVAVVVPMFKTPAAEASKPYPGAAVILPPVAILLPMVVAAYKTPATKKNDKTDKKKLFRIVFRFRFIFMTNSRLIYNF